MVDHGSPLSEREREVIRGYQQEVEVQCQLVVREHGTPDGPGVRCYAVSVYFGECRECGASMFLCRTHGYMFMVSEDPTWCAKCQTRRQTKMLFKVTALPMGVL